MNRAERRHHFYRLKKSRKNYWCGHLGEHGRKVSCPKPCSCNGCCNRRKIDGPTKQELRKDQDE